MFYTGTYRFLETYTFKIEIAVAILIELFISIIPPLAIMVTNNDRVKENSKIEP